MSEDEITAQDHTAKMFIGHGFQAFFALMLGRGTRSGKIYLRLLDTKPAEDKEIVAVTIAHVKPHQSVLPQIDAFTRHIASCKVRRKILSKSIPSLFQSTGHLSLSPIAPEKTPMVTPSPRTDATSWRVLHEMLPQNQPGTLQSNSNSGSSSVASEATSANIVLTETIPAEFKGCSTGPLFAHLAHVFHPSLCKSIRRTGDKACLTVSFLEDASQISCLVSASIMNDHVEELVLNLFGLRLKTEGLFREFIIPPVTNISPEDSVKIHPEHFVKIRPEDSVISGVRDEAVQKFLGRKILQAVVESAKREEETTEGTRLKHRIQMVIPSRNSHDGRLDIVLGLEQGWALHAEMFPTPKSLFSFHYPPTFAKEHEC
ncbi:hypothetical protein DM02DRAFT_617543 [Periconia macrospinosa]|uniref:Uncharacterized protein n=1 Tax=Periconia macrospinosa TaxID=97972 RepID=A0A2V1DDA6_9PLEO|nr:hypothetical protein DM02DRAFT_617543 [Periconia macrospinosa]